MKTKSTKAEIVVMVIKSIPAEDGFPAGVFVQVQDQANLQRCFRLLRSTDGGKTYTDTGNKFCPQAGFATYGFPMPSQFKLEAQ